jgi:hypothetical protein
MVRLDFSALEGVLSGAKEITILSSCPFLFPNMKVEGLLLILAGGALSLINTRAMLPFALLAMLFVEEREQPWFISAVQITGMLFFMVWQAAWLYAGFAVFRGIQ